MLQRVVYPRIAPDCGGRAARCAVTELHRDADGAVGFQAEKSLNDTIKNNKGKYIVLVEGAVPTKDGGVYCMIGGKTAESILQDVSKDAAAIIAWGSCASNGCVQAAKPNPTNATPIHKLVDKPVINVPDARRLRT